MDNAQRAQEAKNRAADYRQPGSASTGDSPNAGPRDMGEWTDIVGQRIEQAMRDGAFDNLPGKGKPLNLNRDVLVPDDQQMAFKLLQNNDLKPAWISERSELLTAIERLRQTIRSTTRWHRREMHRTSDSTAAARLSQSWSAQLDQWRQEIVELNKRIESLNLQQPVDQLEIFKLRLEDELATDQFAPDRSDT